VDVGYNAFIYRDTNVDMWFTLQALHLIWILRYLKNNPHLLPPGKQ